MTVQKNLRQLKDDCERIVSGIVEAVQVDKEMKASNMRNRIKVRIAEGCREGGEAT